MIYEVAFWMGIGFVLYVYVGYPMLLALMSGITSRSNGTGARREVAVRPKVTVIISAYNERACIAEKLENTLALDYPPECLEIIVVSDCSDDGTDEIVESYGYRGVQLLRMAVRGGKTLGLNAAVARASGRVVLFSDANALYRTDAIHRIVGPFAEPSVGAVIGESTYRESESSSGRCESLYWRYETWIKALESRHGSVVGGDGAIYAVRRTLYEPMSADALSDFVNPLQVVRRGFRCVYEPRALSYEDAALDFRQEYRRKVRIVNRAWHALWSMREMLNPLKHGAFALRLWSHKVLRWCMPVVLLLVFIVNLRLLDLHAAYSLSLALQIGFYLLAMGGYMVRHRNEQGVLLRVPFYFCLVNLAAAVALLQALRGRSYTTWEPTRAEG